MFHHAQNIPATLTPLSTLDRATGATLKNKPRVLSKGTSAIVKVTLRGGTMSDTTSASGITRVAIEPFKDNKDMGRVLLRRSGETVAAGMPVGSIV